MVDVADAHVVAARALDAGVDLAPAYNISRAVGSVRGRGDGHGARRDRHRLRAEVVGRRPGDPARIVGRADAIARDLGWKATLDLDDMVTSVWEAWNAG